MIWDSKYKNDQKQKMTSELQIFLKNHDAELIKFEWFYKAFGDIIVEIRYKNQIHVFASDRGDIYYNNRPVCNNSYHVAGQSDTFPKIMETIEKVLF